MSQQIAAITLESGAVPHRRSLRAVTAPSFLECVATVAAEERQRAQDRGLEAELIDIAYWSRASQGAISRFENHHSQPRELDRLLAAYAKVCGVPAAQILREAVDRWEDAGGDLETPPSLEAAEASERLAERAERTRGSSAPSQPGRKRRPA